MTLHLTLKKKWFDLILSGQKTEEYREIKPYWTRRLIDRNFAWDCASTEKMRIHYEACPNGFWKQFDKVKFTNGYGKNSPMMEMECRWINAGFPKPQWYDDKLKQVFIIGLGKIITTKNCGQ